VECWQGVGDQPGERGQVHQAGEEDDHHDQQDDAAQQDHRLRITQRIKQAKEDQRDKQDINEGQPVDSLEYKEEIIEKFGHGYRLWGIGLWYKGAGERRFPEPWA